MMEDTLNFTAEIDPENLSNSALSIQVETHTQAHEAICPVLAIFFIGETKYPAPKVKEDRDYLA